MGHRGPQGLQHRPCGHLTLIWSYREPSNGSTPNSYKELYIWFDVYVIGGCGQVGPPLSIAFALRSKGIAVFDIDRDKVASVSLAATYRIEEGRHAHR